MNEQVLDQILQEMRQGFATVNGRLDRVDERLESLEGRSIDRRMLEALTVKNIEQEAEIRALKQA